MHLFEYNGKVKNAVQVKQNDAVFLASTKLLRGGEATQKCIMFYVVVPSLQGPTGSCQSTRSLDSTKRLSSHIRFRQRPKSNPFQEQRATEARVPVRESLGLHQSGQ